MPLTYTTATIGGVEMALDDWGMKSCRKTSQNQGEGQFEFSVVAPADEALPFAFDTNIIIKIGRIASRLNPINSTLPASVNDGGGALTFTGGTQWFWGYALEPERSGNPESEALRYKLIGSFTRFFGELIFKKLQMTWSPTLAKMIADWKTQIILGMSLTVLTGAGDTVQASTATNLMSIAQQLKEICLFAQMQSALEQAENGLAWPATGVINGFTNPQFKCDALTQTVDGVNYDLLQTPSTNCLIADYAGTPLSGKTSASALPSGSYQLRAPLDAVNAISCKEALERTLQWLGGIGSPVLWMDDSQTPPQLHIATRATITTADPGNTTTAQRMGGGYKLNLPYTDQVSIISPTIRKCTELIPSAVAFSYKVSGTYLGQPYDVFYDDIAAYQGGVLIEGIGEFGALTSLSGAALTSTQETNLRAAANRSRAINQTFNLQGNKTSASTCKITCQSISGALSNAGDAAWLQIFPNLRQCSNLGFASGAASITITSPDGSTTYYSGGSWASTAYTNWVTDGQVAPWMLTSAGTPQNPVAGQTVKAKIVVRFSGTQKLQGTGSNTASPQQFDYKEFDNTITLTTLSSGTYASQPTLQAGEPIPVGLAGYILALESIPQYDGVIVIKEQEITDVAPIGNLVNLTGGRAEWATMNAQVQMVVYDLDAGTTAIHFGPSGHLAPAQLLQRMVNNIGPRWYELIFVSPTNNTPDSNSLGNNMPSNAPIAGGENSPFKQFLASANAAINTPDSTHLDQGIHLNAGGNWGGGTAPSISSGNTELIGASGGTANQWWQLDAGRPKFLLNYSSTCSILIDAHTAQISVAGFTGVSALLDGSAAQLTLTYTSGETAVMSANTPALTLTIPSGGSAGTATLVPGTLNLVQGGATINLACSLLPSGSIMQPMQLIFCIGGSTYSAYFAMTTPVPVS